MEDPILFFNLLEKLGEGSYGSVYKAQAIRRAFGGDVSPGDIVAIKIVPVEKEQDELLNEINILEQCKSTYITRYFGSYMKDEDCWIVMEFCGAGSVNDIMVSAGITLTEDIISVRDSFMQCRQAGTFDGAVAELLYTVCGIFMVVACSPQEPCLSVCRTGGVCLHPVRPELPAHQATAGDCRRRQTRSRWEQRQDVHHPP